MKNILEEYNRVIKTFVALPNLADHRNRNFKDDREWWVLGRLKVIFNNEGLNSEFPDYADKLSENNTDFVTSFNGNDVYKKIQVTEILPPHISRSSDYWVNYYKTINKKLQCDFGPDNWLLVYFDIAYFKITSIGFWHNLILEKSKSIDFFKSKFERIIAINANGDAAVSIYPYSFVICPEWNSSGSTIVDKYLFIKKKYYKILNE